MATALTPAEDPGLGEQLENDEQDAPGAQRIQLTPRECSLLACLVERARHPISPAELLGEKWTLTFNPRTGIVDVQPSQEQQPTSHHSDVFVRPASKASGTAPATTRTRSR